MQRYRNDWTGKTETNGSIPCYAVWMSGPSLSVVKKCPCEDGVSRAVYVQGEADTYFSIPAATRIKGKYAKGWIGHEESGYYFCANKPETV